MICLNFAYKFYFILYFVAEHWVHVSNPYSKKKKPNFFFLFVRISFFVCSRKSSICNQLRHNCFIQRKKKRIHSEIIRNDTTILAEKISCNAASNAVENISMGKYRIYGWIVDKMPTENSHQLYVTCKTMSRSPKTCQLNCFRAERRERNFIWVTDFDWTK